MTDDVPTIREQNSGFSYLQASGPLANVPTTQLHVTDITTL